MVPANVPLIEHRFLSSLAAQRLSYCGKQAYEHDRDRFLTTLFAPADRREALFALIAFNIEIAKTREVVSEALLGQIRLQWWRDAIGEIYSGAPRRHEVIGPLAEAVDRWHLDRRSFDTLIDARAADPASVADAGHRGRAGVRGRTAARDRLGHDGPDARRAVSCTPAPGLLANRGGRGGRGRDG